MHGVVQSVVKFVCINITTTIIWYNFIWSWIYGKSQPHFVGVMLQPICLWSLHVPSWLASVDRATYLSIHISNIIISVRWPAFNDPQSICAADRYSIVRSTWPNARLTDRSDCMQLCRSLFLIPNILRGCNSYYISDVLIILWLYSLDPLDLESPT